MKNTRILVNCTGFIGDILFASSVAKKLKNQEDCTIDYLIQLHQPEQLLRQNPHINEVFVQFEPPYQYDRVINLHGQNFNYEPPVWYQMKAGVLDTDPSFDVYTVLEYDAWADEEIKKLREGKPVVACMDGWMEKTYQFTEEQYAAGIDVPNLGYGGKHRNISYIIEQLQEYLTLVNVGKPIDFSARSTTDSSDYTAQASIIKKCDAFIGTEGGLANLACGVGTKTILTGDFVLQLYGWNGSVRKHKQPKLGPIWYKPGHIEIDPYATDDEVIKRILTCLK
jgi:hypothetical protein